MYISGPASITSSILETGVVPARSSGPRLASPPTTAYAMLASTCPRVPPSCAMDARPLRAGARRWPEIDWPMLAAGRPSACGEARGPAPSASSPTRRTPTAHYFRQTRKGRGTMPHAPSIGYAGSTLARRRELFHEGPIPARNPYRAGSTISAARPPITLRGLPPLPPSSAAAGTLAIPPRHPMAGQTTPRGLDLVKSYGRGSMRHAPEGRSAANRTEAELAA